MRLQETRKRRSLENLNQTLRPEVEASPNQKCVDMTEKPNKVQKSKSGLQHEIDI